MKLRSPTNEPVHVALLSGHAIRIGTEPREIPIEFRKEAFAKGCIPEGVDPADMDKPIDAATEKTKNESIKDGIKKMLETENKDDFTGSGLPHRAKLSALIGLNVSAEELTAAWQELEAEAA